MTASAAILNLLVFIVMRRSFLQYGELAHYLNLTLISYVNKTAILQYGD